MNSVCKGMSKDLNCFRCSDGSFLYTCLKFGISGSRSSELYRFSAKDRFPLYPSSFWDRFHCICKHDSRMQEADIDIMIFLILKSAIPVVCINSRCRYQSITQRYLKRYLIKDASHYMFRPIAGIIRFSSGSMVVVLYRIGMVVSRWWDLITITIPIL